MFLLRSYDARMFTSDQLRAKALLALEDAVQECRYRTPRRSFALRFALAYLWAISGAEREPFERFWRRIGDAKTPWSFSAANSALAEVYRALKIERDEAAAFAMWRRRFDEEQEAGSHDGAPNPPS